MREVTRPAGGEDQARRPFPARGRLPRVLAVTALVAGVFTACSSSSKSSTPTSRAGSAGSGGTAAANNSSCSSQPGITPTEVKVGLTYAETGITAAADNPFGPSAEARFQLANDNGGINGRKISWSAADTASDPGRALSAGQGLVESNGVFAILNGTSMAAPMFPYLVSNDIPTFDVLTDDPLFATAKNLFTTEGAWYTAGGGTLNAPLWAQFLQQQGVTSFAIFDSGSPSGLAAGKADAAAIEKAGIKLVYEDDATPSNAFDATSIALRIKQVKPDALVFPLALAGSVSIYKAAQQQGVTPKVSLMSNAYDPTALTAGIAGAYATVSYVPYLGDVSTLAQPAQAFRNGMAKYAPQVTALNLYAAGGWADADLFLHALQLAGHCPTRDGLVSAMRSEKSFNPANLMPGPIQYSPGLTSDGNPLNCTEFVKINTDSFSSSSPVCVPVPSS